ncbi:MAG: enolase C-terminal domain-like protein [Bacteroidota bacterium]
MLIQRISAHHLQIPLKLRFAQANQSTHHSSSVIVEVKTSQGIIGYGECCPREYVTGESVDSVLSDIAQMDQQLKGRRLVSVGEIERLICDDLLDEIGLSTRCGLELALLDALCRTAGVRLIDALGGDMPEELSYSGVMPFGKIEKLGPVLQRFGFDNAKIKVGPDLHQNVEKVLRLQQDFLPEACIRVDANCSWTFNEAIQQIPALVEAGVRVIEQPLAKGKEAEMAVLTRLFGDKVWIMADESVTDHASAEKLIREGQCNRLNLKLSKNGGIFSSLRIYGLAQKYGVSCQLGAHFGETSILTAAGMVFASLAGELTALEGAFGPHILSKDISETSIGFGAGGKLENPNLHLLHAGLGLQIG